MHLLAASGACGTLEGRAVESRPPGPDVLEAWHAWAGAAVAAGARAGSTQRAGSERFAAAQA